jgi:hypothetical protein
MAATQEKASEAPDNGATTIAESNPRSVQIDPTAPAGSKNSLGEESIRDGRPANDDNVVEAIDEANPGVPVSPAR